MDQLDFSLINLDESNWRDFRKIRLEALKNHPDLFAPSEDETTFTQADWKARLANPNAGTFGLYSSDDIIGLTGIVVDRNDPTRGIFIMSYIREAFRQKGLSSLFYKQRIEWASQHPTIKTVESGHVEGNQASYKANQRFGFRSTGSHEHIGLNGVKKRIFTYERSVKYKD
ncbi:MAG: GNAT family N-acetyltransferase [Pseudobacteriovorax sp.]|nr:GNAT family N-acetyltransferase [Pseudobacteriovorax sp.]